MLRLVALLLLVGLLPRLVRLLLRLVRLLPRLVRLLPRLVGLLLRLVRLLLGLVRLLRLVRGVLGLALIFNISNESRVGVVHTGRSPSWYGHRAA